MSSLSASLSHFSRISLEEMDNVKLLDRIDTKFIVHENQLPEFLDAVATNYDLLVIDGNWSHPYETLYFDTPGFQLYFMHHNGKRNRYKLRSRKYVNSGISYFEIKTKTNTSRTVKHRMKVDVFPELIDSTLIEYISKHTPGDPQTYVPSLRVFFDRITLVNRVDRERLTFDTNLRYQNNGSEIAIEDIVIAEIKQEKHSVSPFAQFMKIHRQRSHYISKYCLGITRMNSSIKTNLFKHKLDMLKKMGYDL